MARITVEDCLEHVDNRFQLVLVATKRARQLALGAQPMVKVENDKSTVIALREIAEGKVTKAILDEDQSTMELEQQFEAISAPESSPEEPTDADSGAEEETSA